MRSKAAPSGRERHQSAATARSKDQSFPRSRMTGNESRDDAFKKGTIFAAAGPSEDRTGFHLGQHSSPPNATPRQPRRPQGQDDRAAPRHGLCPRAPRYHHLGRRPSIQDLDTTSPETRRTPTKETSRKVHLSHPWATPSVETHRSAKTGIHRRVLLPRARDELSPAASRGGRGQSCCTVRETSSVLQHRDARRAVDRSWERTSPSTKVAPDAEERDRRPKQSTCKRADPDGEANRRCSQNRRATV